MQNDERGNIFLLPFQLSIMYITEYVIDNISDNIHYEYQRREMISHIWTGHEVFSRTDPKLQFYIIFQIVIMYIIRSVLQAL